MAPMAVLSREVQDREDAALVLDRLHDYLVTQLPSDLELLKNLWTTAELFLGLKFKGEENKAWIKSLNRGVLSVKDSIIHQDIFEEGKAAGFGKGRKDASKGEWSFCCCWERIVEVSPMKARKWRSKPSPTSRGSIAWRAGSTRLPAGTTCSKSSEDEQ